MLDLANAKNKEAETKISECVIELLFRSPLFGLTVLGTAIRVKEATQGECERMATDGRTIWYAPAWVLAKPAPSIMFDVLHEALHVYGNHPARRGERDHKVWNIACDVRVAHDALNICRARGPWELDADHIKAYPWAAGLTAEQIYDELIKDSEKQPKDFAPDMLECELSEEEDREFQRQFTQDVTQAATAEEQTSKKSLEATYGSSIWERLQELKRCDVPWNVLLQGRLCAALGNEIATWVPPNRKWLPEIALPSRKGTQQDELVLGIDVSTSITEDDLKRFRACVMPAARRAKITTLITFDEQIREIHSSRRPEVLLHNLRFKTGSHSSTSVVDVFAEVEKRKPTAVAIITDGYVTLPNKEYRGTHWIVTPTGTFLPWGRNYRMKQSW
jgi:predicted metal-dependent peptidase